MAITKTRQLRNRQEQERRLALFADQDSDHYEARLIDGFWYVKHFNQVTGRWQVAVYTPEAYKRYSTYNNAIREEQELDNTLAHAIDADE